MLNIAEIYTGNKLHNKSFLLLITGHPKISGITIVEKLLELLRKDGSFLWTSSNELLETCLLIQEISHRLGGLRGHELHTLSGTTIVL